MIIGKSIIKNPYTNPFGNDQNGADKANKKKVAEEAAKQLRQQTDKQVNNLLQEANLQADQILKEAEAQAAKI